MSGRPVDLGAQILDRGLLDNQGRYAGKADDLVFEFNDPTDASGGECPGPVVVAIVSGPMALSRNMSRPVQWLARAVYRLLGLNNPKPSEVPWSDVASFDVVVHLSCDRIKTGWSPLGEAVDRRFIGRLPGSG
jgi:hypothetical protein